MTNSSSCNVNYNIKKNIINLNLKQQEEQQGDSSNYEEEEEENLNSNSKIIKNKNSKANSIIEKNQSRSLKNFNQQESYINNSNNNLNNNNNNNNNIKSSRKNTSNSKKKQQTSSGYFNNNKDYDEDYNGSINLSLTNKVWPKSRTFLSIVSKMFNENYIDEYQRGILKEMIMDHNLALNKILEEYEIDADSKKLYESIIQLADSYDKNKNVI